MTTKPWMVAAVKEHRKVSLFPRKTVKLKVGKPLDITSLIDDHSPEAKHTRTELGIVTDAMLDAVTELLEDIRGEKAPIGRWNPPNQNVVKLPVK